jgi:transposase
VSVQTLARRVLALDDEMVRIDELLADLVSRTAPSLLALHGVGVDSAATLLAAAGDNPERLRSEATWAHLCGVSQIVASSGKVVRHRLNRGGDRQANSALWRIVMVRMASHPPTRAYIERRTKEGRSKIEIMRMLKRYVAREVYRHLPRA